LRNWSKVGRPVAPDGERHTRPRPSFKREQAVRRVA
jgi:hypothetical protein